MPAAARGDARVRNFDGVGCAGCGVTTCRRWHFAPTTDILDLLDLNGEALDQSWMAELQEQLTARLQREADAVARAAAAGCSDARQSELKQQQAETKARLAALKDGKHTLGKPRMWFCTGRAAAPPKARPSASSSGTALTFQQHPRCARRMRVRWP